MVPNRPKNFRLRVGDETNAAPAAPPMPELSREGHAYVVTLAYTEEFAALRYSLDRSSLRIWPTGTSMVVHEIQFATPVEPKACVVRLLNGLLEFAIADEGEVSTPNRDGS